MNKPTMRQKLGLDDEYNEKLMREWLASNEGEPPPVGGMRFFPLRMVDKPRQGENDARPSARSRGGSGNPKN